MEIQENDVRVRIEREACGCMAITMTQYHRQPVWIEPWDLEDVIIALLAARRALRTHGDL